VSWREQIRAGYPWMPLAFVAVMAIFIVATLIGLLVATPAERAVIDHGTRTTGHAVAWKNYSRNHSYSWDANITWTDPQGHSHEQKQLPISEREAALLGDGKDVEIQYIGDRAVIVDDIENRVRDESNGPWVLGIWIVCALMGLYHWRRRLREWRAPKPVQW
jgi:hypothetical protein